ncbi:MAG: hypothetical protein ACK5P3_11345, partial [Dolichospermum sp.]
MGNSVALALRGKRHGQFYKLTDHGFNRFESFFITALELRNSGYFCGVLSTGQLAIQISQLCTHNV